MSVLDNLFGLWWVAITSTVAAVTVFWWAWHGPHQTRAARMVLGVALVGLSASYWWQLVADIPAPYTGPAEMRRAAGIVWFPAMVWVAIVGSRQSRRQRQHIDVLVLTITGEDESL